ncbi:MAG: AAA family ATPase [Thermoflexales bacterium]|nr:AAA family ATPase [Thermoflexales bacterium]
MGRTLILSGTPGIGKTTLIKAVIKELGDQAGGFFSEEILGPGGRKGYKLVTLDGQWGIMAHADFKSKSNFGRFGVETHIIDKLGAGAINAALTDKPIVVIDEIGKITMFSSQFQSAAVKAVGSPKVVLATAMSDNHPWLMALKAFPGVTVWEVTKKNRSALVKQALEWVNQNLK